MKIQVVLDGKAYTGEVQVVTVDPQLDPIPIPIPVDPIPIPIPAPVPTPPIPPQPTPEPAPIPIPAPIPVDGTVVPEHLNSGDPNSRIGFSAGQTRTFIIRIKEKVRGFDFLYYPMTDFIVKGGMKLPLRPNGKRYNTFNGQTEFGGLWAGYDGSITLKIWTSSVGAPTIILDDFVYPGDFVVTLTADREGWGFLNTDLHK